MRTTQYIKAEDWVTIAEQLARKNGGVLPNPQALIDQGYWALYQQMRRDKQAGTGLFDHIPQDRKISTRRDLPPAKPTRHPTRRKPRALCA